MQSDYSSILRMRILIKLTHSFSVQMTNTASISGLAVNRKKDGVFLEGELGRLRAVAVGPDGHLYVADSQNHRIAVFDAQGEMVDTFGTYGLASEPAVAIAPPNGFTRSSVPPPTTMTGTWSCRRPTAPWAT